MKLSKILEDSNFNMQQPMGLSIITGASMAKNDMDPMPLGMDSTTDLPPKQNDESDTGPLPSNSDTPEEAIDTYDWLTATRKDPSVK